MKRFSVRVFCIFLFCALLSIACSNLLSSAPARTLTVLAAFGSTEPSAQAAFDAIASAYTTSKHDILWAYTSDKVRKKLASQGTTVLSTYQALDKAAKMGVRDICVQSLHIAPAEEFHHLERAVLKYTLQNPDHFSSVRLGAPLLDSFQDLQEVVAAVIGALPAQRQPNDAVLLMAHGNDSGAGDLVLLAAQRAFQEKDSRIWLAAVEGALSFDAILPRLKEMGIRRVWLQPFMMVAGDHARNDLVGADEDSWASRLRAEGMEVLPHLKGLGELPAVQAVLLRHTKNSVDDLRKSKKMDLR